MRLFIIHCYNKKNEYQFFIMPRKIPALAQWICDNWPLTKELDK